MPENKTTSITIQFSTVLSFQDLKPSLKVDMNEGGVYIWGLVFPKKNNQPTGLPIDNNLNFDEASQMFIPYYVGQSGKSLWGCFNQRHNNPLRNNLYIILSYDYIKEFYKDCKFSETVGVGSNRKKEWFENEQDYFVGKIIYYNNYHILKHLYRFGCEELTVQENYSTECVKDALLKTNKKSDAITRETYRMSFFKKMFFCYAKGFKTETLDYKDFENYIFYRLKGKTLSKHDSFKKVQQKFSSITINLTSPLKLFKPAISQSFHGY